MDGELELSGQIADKGGNTPGKQYSDSAIKTSRAPSKQHSDSAIQSGVGKATRRLQAWHYLIPICAAFWVLFATILIISGFPFLIVALIIIALLSVLIIALAWAFQNNI